MKIHLAVNSGFVQMVANVSKNLQVNNDHFFVVYGEQMTGQIIDKTTIDDNFVILNKLSESTISIIEKLQVATTIYIHFLSNEVIEFLEKYNIENKKIVWFFWGADAFGLPEIYTQIKQYRTDKAKQFLGKVKQLFVPQKTAKVKLDFLKKIDIVAHYSIDDFELIQSLLKSTAQLQYFTYGIVDFIIDKEVEVVGNDILLGNSASVNNNHIYAIKHILPKNIQQNIICPLPYGSSNSYVQEVLEAGDKKFGNKFKAFTQLINTKDYHSKILTQAKYAIMPHNRSQAWGNIMQLLWQGSCVFMFKSNNLYKFLQQKGFQIFELNKKNVAQISTLQVDVATNRKLLQQHFSLKNLMTSYKNILSL